MPETALSALRMTEFLLRFTRKKLQGQSAADSIHAAHPFIGQTSVAKEQSKTIPEAFNKLGMHYGWLGKRAVLYVDDIYERLDEAQG